MIDRLEQLLALAREKHFGRAAEACGVSQPTLSASVKYLEETFGTSLVERGSRFVGFTPAGERVLDWARRIVADSRAMRQDVQGFRRALSGTLRIAAIPTALPRLIRLTAPYARANPGVRLSILSRSSDEIGRMLLDLEVEAGVTYLDGEPLRKVDAVPLYRERFRYVCTEADPLAQRPSLAWGELGGTRLCLLTPDMQNRRIVDRALAAAEVTPVVAMVSDSMLTLLVHVRTGAWASILPEQWVAGLPAAQGLRAIPLTTPEVGNLVGLVVPHREPANALTAALLASATRLDQES